MSGGIDSAVASAILSELGHEVIGAYLRLHEYQIGETKAFEAASMIGIPIFSISIEHVFKKEVVTPFLSEHKCGFTPNPCLICNQKVKFAILHEVAERIGADAIATGHYARIDSGPGGRAALFRGRDATKDQSYMLYRLAASSLERIILPLGEYSKTEVRKKGRHLFPGLFDTADESEDICFIPKGDLGSFIQNNAGPFSPGRIVTTSGHAIGMHSGLHMFTIGQRKGLGLSGGPWFVCRKNLVTNELIVGRKENISGIRCREAVWHDNPVKGIALSACHRYRSRLIGCVIDSVNGSSFSCLLDEPERGAAPGQSLVLYSDDRVYGGGIIEETWRGGSVSNEQ